MNVLYTIQTHGPGGAESVIVNLAKCFNNDHWRAHGFFLTDGWIADEFRRNSLPVEVSNSKWLLDIPLLLSLVSYVRKHSISVMHAHEFYMGFYCGLVSAITGIPCITTYHGKSPYSLERRIRYLAFKQSLKRTLPVAVSHDLENWIVSNYRVPPDRVRVVHNGIDAAAFVRGTRDRNDCRSHILDLIGAPEESVLVATVARLFPVKGVKYLVEAASIVHKGCPSVHFVVAGDGPDRPALEALVTQEGLAAYFHFLGECGFVPRVLCASDMFVLPSNSEELSISILEALASRLPVIATDVGDNRYLIQEGRNGFLVPKQRPELLAERIQYLLDRRDLWTTMGKESESIVAGSFSNEAMIEKYRELYENARKG